jgi:hypothetical protein
VSALCCAVDQTLRGVEDEQVPSPVNLSLNRSLALLPGDPVLKPRCPLDSLAEPGASLKLDVFVPDCCQSLCPESYALKSLPTSPGKAGSPSSVFQGGSRVVKEARESGATRSSGSRRCSTRWLLGIAAHQASVAPLLLLVRIPRGSLDAILMVADYLQ